MEVLPAGLADDAGVALVDVNILCDVLPELLEDEGAAGEVKSGEVWVGDRLADDCFRDTRNELDDAWGNASFGKDFVYDVVGVGRSR